MKELEKIKLEWQEHNRDNGMTWNEVAELVNQIASLYQSEVSAEEIIDSANKIIDKESSSRDLLKDVSKHWCEFGIKYAIESLTPTAPIESDDKPLGYIESSKFLSEQGKEANVAWWNGKECTVIIENGIAKLIPTPDQSKSTK